MLNIALLGTDSTHSDVYAQLLNCSDKFPSACANSIWGIDYIETCNKAAKYNISNVYKTPDKAIVNSDLVIVCSRYGDDHYKPAKIALDLKKPTFVDKPFVNNPVEAIELSKISKLNKIPLMSFSPIRFSDELINFRETGDQIGKIVGMVITGPANSSTVNEKKSKNIFYYGIHPVDIMNSIVQDKITATFISSSDIGIWVNVKFSNGTHCTLNFPYDITEKYSAAIYGSLDHRFISIESISSCFENTLRFLLSDLVPYNSNSIPLKYSIQSIELLNEINNKIQFKGI